MNKTITNRTRSDKPKQHVKCPFCSMRLIIAYGFYVRYHPERHELITIQRYKCKVKSCPIKTFSLPPVPLLRIVRHAYQTLKQVYNMQRVGMNQAFVSRMMGLSRGIIKRLFTFCPRFFHWLAHEQNIVDWGPYFYTKPYKAWPSFIRDFSHTFYPARYGKISPTQNIHITNQLVMS